MKKLLMLFITGVSAFSLLAQSFEKNVPHFMKVIVSPRVNLVMVKGDAESVRITYSNVDASKINVTVKGEKLRIYLDGSRFTEKRKRVKRDGWVEKKSAYLNASITAYVTYRNIDKLVARGEQVVEVQSAIENKRFKLSAYGECDITLASLQTRKFKVSLFGQHHLKIKSGAVDWQKYRLFGENKIDVQGVQGQEIVSATYGESKLKFSADESLRLLTFGESDVAVKGKAHVNDITFGDISLNK